MHRWWIALTLVAVLAGGCGGDGESSPEPAYAAGWQQIVDDFTELRADLEIPAHFAGVDMPIRDGTEFDAGSFFTVLTHIDVEPGFVLDYVYRSAPDRGFPVLYTRRADGDRLPTYEAYLAATGRDAVGADDVGFLDQVYVVDGTSTGFFEYAVLRLVGSHFYRFWHAREDDDRIVVTRDALDAVLRSVEEEMAAAEVAKAREVDPAPVVTYEGDQVTVEIVTFTRWGGLYRHTLVIERIFPQLILDESAELLAVCDCGPPL